MHIPICFQSARGSTNLTCHIHITAIVWNLFMVSSHFKLCPQAKFPHGSTCTCAQKNGTVSAHFERTINCFSYVTSTCYISKHNCFGYRISARYINFKAQFFQGYFKQQLLWLPSSIAIITLLHLNNDLMFLQPCSFIILHRSLLFFRSHYTVSFFSFYYYDYMIPNQKWFLGA